MEWYFKKLDRANKLTGYFAHKNNHLFCIYKGDFLALSVTNLSTKEEDKYEPDETTNLQDFFKFCNEIADFY